MILLFILTYIFVGIIAGLLSGLLGISGGVVAVPALFYIFKLMGFPQASIMHYAIGTSLTSMAFNTLSAAWYHNKNGYVQWPIVKHMALGIVFGSLTGALVADLLSGIILQILFGVFACLLGIELIRSPKLKTITNHPSILFLSMMGFFIGFISNILGIGGGIMVVPLLLMLGVNDKKAIGTSAATGFLITSLGALSYLVYGFEQAPYPYAFGYLYLPAFIVISITTFLAAPFGAKLSHRMNIVSLRRTFACVMLVVGLLMLFA